MTKAEAPAVFKRKWIRKIKLNRRFAAGTAFYFFICQLTDFRLTYLSEPRGHSETLHTSEQNLIMIWWVHDAWDFRETTWLTRHVHSVRLCQTLSRLCHFLYCPDFGNAPQSPNKSWPKAKPQDHWESRGKKKDNGTKKTSFHKYFKKLAILLTS